MTIFAILWSDFYISNFAMKKPKKETNPIFIFSLDKKKVYEVEKGAKAICCYKNYGPVFYGYEYCYIYKIIWQLCVIILIYFII